jgi:hypothetical protein
MLSTGLFTAAQFYSQLQTALNPNNDSRFPNFCSMIFTAPFRAKIPVVDKYSDKFSTFRANKREKVRICGRATGKH